MYSRDNIYRLILKHRLPISRGKESVKNFLRSYFDNYIQEYKSALIRTDECIVREECYALLERYVPMLETLCNDIIKVYDLYDNANMPSLYKHFSDMMGRISSLLTIHSLMHVYSRQMGLFYRVRAGKDDYERKDLFHIPMDKRHLINSYRYSIPGYPCLYLSSGLELCWFECGMPKDFSYVAFSFEQSLIENERIIDFSYLPIDVVSATYLDYRNRPTESILIDKFLAKYLVLFPLRVACSLAVENRNVAFVEEYIFPQQLLLWIRDTDNYIGVAYRTCSYIERARDWNYINIVLPAKQIKNGYSKYLNDIFYVTKPVKVSVSNVVKNNSDNIIKVRDFVHKIEAKCNMGYYIYPYRELLSLCKTFLILCNMLENDNYTNGEAIYQSMDTLNLMSYLISDHSDSLKEKTLKDIDETNKDYIQCDFEDIMDSFNKEVKPIIFEFWSYITRAEGKSELDYKTSQHIFTDDFFKD